MLIDEIVLTKEISSKTADYLFIENPRTAKLPPQADLSYQPMNAPQIVYHNL